MMSNSAVLRLRRGAASFLAGFTGAPAEVLVDTTNWRLQVHDGLTPGGWPVAKRSDIDDALTGLGLPKSTTTATAMPMPSNDAAQGYAAGSRWLRADTGDEWRCRSAALGAAVWQRTDLADFFGYVAGNWYLPFGMSGQGSGSSAASGNRLLMFPWVNKQLFTLAALGLLVTTAAAGGNVQIAVYAADPATGQATGLPIVATASMSTAATGVVNAAATAALDPGLYWIAVNIDNTTVRFQSMTNTAPFVAQVVGTSSESIAATASANISFHAIAQTFGAWPNLTGVANPPAGTGLNYMPVVHFRVASVP